jgi:hypothetical protein
VHLIKFLEKKSRISHSNLNSHFKDDIMHNHEQKKKEKKVKNQDSMGKTNFFLSILPFNSWAVLATWLHVRVPQKIHKK